MKWWRTSLDLAPKRCSSSIKPFISVRSAANNQREVPVSWREQEQEPFLKIYRISEQKPPSVAPHPNKCFVVLEPAGAWKTCWFQIKLPAAPIHPSVAPVPLPPPSPYSNKTHGTGHLCGNNKPQQPCLNPSCWAEGRVFETAEPPGRCVWWFLLGGKEQCLSLWWLCAGALQRIVLNPVLWCTHMSHTKTVGEIMKERIWICQIFTGHLISSVHCCQNKPVHCYFFFITI